MARGSTQGRRLTKAERRDQARREREELQRKMARRSRNRRIGVGLVAVAVVGGVAAVAILAGTGIASPAELLEQAPEASREAGCGDVETTPPYDPASADQAHIGGAEFPAPPRLSTYPTVPPASGPHDPMPLPAGFYDTAPPIDQAIHSLEHGAAIVWYAPSAAGDEALADIQEFYGQRLSQENAAQDRVIVAPYDYPEQGEAGTLPDGTRMALVAWHRLETCGRVSLAAAFDFTSRLAFPTAAERSYEGEAPEAGGAL